MEINEEIDDFNEKTDSAKCDKLAEKILKLNKRQPLKKISTIEPTFGVFQSTTNNTDTVELDKATKSLKKRRKSVKVRNKLSNVKGKNVVLPKLLEKPQADRIRRAVAYEQTRLELDRWEAIVTSNRVSTNLNFPLDNDFKLEKKNAANFVDNWRLKSDFEQELEKFEPKIVESKVETDKVPLTLKEMQAKRKEQAKLRAFEGYKSAKARRQNKIKSKRYHRVQKREKIKMALKEFEQLQKTNPEEALRKLEEIDKVRAEERFNLRHKGTGSWAKNKQIRAKYDKESRKELAQQLTLSRDLTQKINTEKDSDDELDVEIADDLDIGKEDNVWINGIKPDKEVQNFIGNYRKFWAQNNVEGSKEKEGNNGISEENTQAREEQDVGNFSNQRENELVKKNKVRNVKEKVKSTTEWEIGEIDEIFGVLEDKLTNKIEKLKKGISLKTNRKGLKRNVKKDPKIDLNLPIKVNRPIIDEEMIETTYKANNEEDSLNTLKTIINTKINKNTEITINPEEYKNTIGHLENARPDLIVTNEEGDETEENQIDLINEALEDDDIEVEFNEEKQKEIDASKPKAIDLSLPGWGCWGGKNIQPSKRKNKRFIMKVPSKLKRKDDNKKLLIINEKAQKQIREYQVNELPFPFKTIKDYEASIRQPISNTFVPERAFKKLVKPSVTTKMGAIIRPISKDVLLKKPEK